MRSEKTDKRILRTECRCNGGYTYKYKLSAIESTKVVSYKLPLYSISVELTDKYGSTTEADTKELFGDIGKATSFFDMLVRNLATPIDLAYIVEDEVSV